MLKSLSVLMALATLPAAATDTYLVEPMLCQGKIFGDTKGVHPDYFQVLMKFTSFKSTKKDGTLVDSLQVENAYFGPTETITPGTEDFAEAWFMGPLKKSGNRVFRASLSGRDDDLELKVVSTDGTTEILSGTYSDPHSVAGSYGYNLTCKATLTDKPKRVDDNTAR